MFSFGFCRADFAVRTLPGSAGQGDEQLIQVKPLLRSWSRAYCKTCPGSWSVNNYIAASKRTCTGKPPARGGQNKRVVRDLVS